MFTPEQRVRIRSELIEAARTDDRLSGGAITGSASVGEEDEWSDIDLAFGVRDASNVASALSDFSARMYDRYDALHHLDVASGNWIYRVFLLANTLQVDLAFVQEEEFGPRAPTFKLVFGKSVKGFSTPTNTEQLIATAWLYALHARSSIARKKTLQAEYMISAMRDNVLSLACLRHNLPAKEGRGVDRLPADLIASTASSLVRSLEPDELSRAFKVTMSLFIGELRSADPRLAVRLERALFQMSS